MNYMNYQKSFIYRDLGGSLSPPSANLPVLFTLFATDTHIYLLSDLQRSLAERLRLLVFASLPVQHSEVVEGRCHRRVVFPQCFLPDGEGVIQEVSCFFILVLIPAEPNGRFNSR